MPCYCSQCFPQRNRTLKTIRRHLKQDQELLYSAEQTHTPEFNAHLQKCINMNNSFLSGGDPDQEGECSVYKD